MLLRGFPLNFQDGKDLSVLWDNVTAVILLVLKLFDISQEHLFWALLECSVALLLLTGQTAYQSWLRRGKTWDCASRLATQPKSTPSDLVNCMPWLLDAMIVRWNCK